MTKGYEQRKEANKRYLAKQDELKIRIPGGLKQAVEEYAAKRGQSINSLMNELLRQEMGFSLEDWTHTGQKTDKT